METVAVRDYVTSTTLTVVNIEGNALFVDTSGIDGDWQFFLYVGTTSPAAITIDGPILVGSGFYLISMRSVGGVLTYDIDTIYLNIPFDSGEKSCQEVAREVTLSIARVTGAVVVTAGVLVTAALIAAAILSIAGLTVVLLIPAALFVGVVAEAIANNSDAILRAGTGAGEEIAKLISPIVEQSICG